MTSVRVRQRLEAAGQRYFANDNIADFIEPGELVELEAEVASQMQKVLQSLVIDTDNDHNTRDTARRVAKMFVREVFSGRYDQEPTVTSFPNETSLNEMMIVGPITVRSACSHHLAPISGRLWIGVLPKADSELIGLSKYVRLARWIMRRPQIQEEAISQLADLLERRLRPQGLALLMQAEHSCMTWRGVEEVDSEMTNTLMRGEFMTNGALRQEFLQLAR